MKYFLAIILAAAVFLPLNAKTARAALSGQEILNQFNLVVLGSATSTSHVDGRSYIGGSLAGGDYVQHVNDTPASNYAGLTVAGSASNVKVNNLGTVIGGSLSGSTINVGDAVVLGAASTSSFNGNYSYYVATDSGGNTFNSQQDTALRTSTAAVAATSTDFKSVLTDLSAQLQKLTGTGSTVTVEGNKATFSAVANSQGIAVFDLSTIDDALFKATVTEFQFNLNGATTVILNSDATDIDIAANFLGGAAQPIGPKTIWNFYEATAIDIKAQFGGSILAPLADLTNTQNIEGGVYVNSLTQQAEIHLQAFTGTIPSTTPVPVPSAMLLLGSGLAGAAIMRVKRRSE
jgi:choice-of-anchor A domain-containing protein